MEEAKLRTRSEEQVVQDDTFFGEVPCTKLVFAE
jgi:hypothetical protein